MLLKKLGKLVLWQRAKDYVARYQPLLIGITGSTGKTVTKEAIGHILRGRLRVRVAPESYNTPVGVALSILGVAPARGSLGWIRLLARSLTRELSTEEPQVIVLELGADRPGDIDFLAQQLPFRIGVVTSVGSTHLRLFGFKENVAHEKKSLIVSLPRDGHAVLSADDPLVRQMGERTGCHVDFYGTAHDASVQLVRAHRLPTYGFACEIAVDGARYEIALPHIIARHQLGSILAALTVGWVMKLDIRYMIDRLQSFVPPAGRMRLLQGITGSQIIDDSYNASPEATLAALETLRTWNARRKIAILGDMLDLGGESRGWHVRVGKHASEVANIFIAVGEEMRAAGAAALRNQHGADVHHFEDSRDVGKWLAEYVREGDCILVKGSRAMHMEEVVRRLVQPYGESNPGFSVENATS